MYKIIGYLLVSMVEYISIPSAQRSYCGGEGILVSLRPSVRPSKKGFTQKSWS